MAGNEPAAQEAAAVRDAVLRSHEEHVRLVLSMIEGREGRVRRWLDRLRLSWLALPWDLVHMVRAVGWGRRLAFETARDDAVRLYRKLTGKDPGVAGAEISRMTDQLESLDGRLLELEEDRPSRPPGADRAELEAAAGALAGYYLRGRSTDDDLLRQVEAAWAEIEELEAREDDETAEGLLRRGHRERLRLIEEQQDEAVDRYVAAWRRWLDHQRRAR